MEITMNTGKMSIPVDEMEHINPLFQQV